MPSAIVITVLRSVGRTILIPTIDVQHYHCSEAHGQSMYRESVIIIVEAFVVCMILGPTIDT